MKTKVVGKNCIFLLDSLGVGGSERKTIVAANKLAEKGFCVHIAFLNLNVDISSTIAPSINTINLSRKGKIDFNVIRQLRQYIQKNHIEVLWSVNLYPMFYAFLATRRNKTIRVFGSSNVSHFRNVYEKLKMFIYVPIIWQIEAFIFGSTRQMAEWQRIYPIGRTKCVAIHNGVDTNKFSLSSYGLNKKLARKQFNLPESDLVIVMVAQFRVEKAHDDLIRAVNNVLESGENITVLLVGEGGMHDEIYSLIEQLGMTQRVVFAGLLHDVRPALVASDVFALTSIAVETFSNAALEAMSMKLPVVLSDIGGAAEMVSEGENGFLYPPGDVTQLAECILNLMDKDKRLAMGKSARRIIEQRFSSETMTENYAKVIASSFEDES